MFPALKQLTIYLAGGIEVVAAVIIGIAAIEAAVRSLPLFVPRITALHDQVEPAAPTIYFLYYEIDWLQAPRTEVPLESILWTPFLQQIPPPTSLFLPERS